MSFNILANRFFIFALITFIFLIVNLYHFEVGRPTSDAVTWYINYAETLHRTGNFGSSFSDDLPDNVIAPLYPFLLKIIQTVDKDVEESFFCLKNIIADEGCLSLKSVFYFQLLLSAISLFVIWLIAFELTGSVSISWMSALFAALSGEPTYYSGLVLTEAVVFFLLCLFSFFLIRFIKLKRQMDILLLGGILGLLTLTRPEYQYIFYVFTLVLISFSLLRNKRIVISCLLFIFIYMLFVGPWIARNHHHFQQLTLTSNYGDRVLVQRLAYNNMSWKEWGVSFIYWLPDFGDSLAESLFEESDYKKLDFSPGSYYRKDSAEIQKEIKQIPLENRISHLFEEKILGNFVKHNLVSIPLAWRGMYISKYWGMFGFLSLVLFFLYRNPNRTLFFLAFMPVLVLLGLYASVSVSIPRYNLGLIIFYSIAMAVLTNNIISSLQTTWHKKKNAIC